MSDAGGTLCPVCYGLVPAVPRLQPYPVSLHHGRLSAHGYRVEVKQSGFLPRVEYETPTGLRLETVSVRNAPVE